MQTLNFLLPIILLLPLVSFGLVQLFNNNQELAIYRTVQVPIVTIMVTLLLIVAYGVLGNTLQLSFNGPVLYESHESTFGINLFLDRFSLVYAVVASAITLLINKFSLTYMHRESGFKRFFSNIIFFYFGLFVIILAGNLELLFIGWEIIGVTSFFLISFYRNRYLPVKNAVKVISIYRVADVALLCGIWVCHHYFGRSISFADVNMLQGRAQEHILDNSIYQTVIPLIFIVVASVKSAQLPFSSWVPRAMEGPTVSSAIFYGSLSVHIGVYLLIRLAPLWDANIAMHGLIAGIGLLTALAASLIARVQPSIKVQIGYSSIAQIGLMFVWVALGWFDFAMFHFACNAFLRTYQLLVSPSVINYRIHDLFYNFEEPQFPNDSSLATRIRSTVYLLGLQELRMDSFMYRRLWLPLKKVGRIFAFQSRNQALGMAILFIGGGVAAIFFENLFPPVTHLFLPEVGAFVGLGFVLRAFVSRGSALFAILWVVINQIIQAIVFSFNDGFDSGQVIIFLSGVLISGIVGAICLRQLVQQGESIKLNNFHGYANSRPMLAFVFVCACLGLSGFPITPTFLGEDIMLGHIHENQFPLLLLIVINLILDGLAMFRIYARLFLGPNVNISQPVAYRSS